MRRWQPFHEEDVAEARRALQRQTEEQRRRWEQMSMEEAAANDPTGFLANVLTPEEQRRIERRVHYPQGRPCEWCGTLFGHKRSTARFCSATCRQRAHRARARRSSS
jgi:hypothetical protein